MERNGKKKKIWRKLILVFSPQDLFPSEPQFVCQMEDGTNEQEEKWDERERRERKQREEKEGKKYPNETNFGGMKWWRYK